MPVIDFELILQKHDKIKMIATEKYKYFEDKNNHRGKPRRRFFNSHYFRIKACFTYCVHCFCISNKLNLLSFGIIQGII